MTTAETRYEIAITRHRVGVTAELSHAAADDDFERIATCRALTARTAHLQAAGLAVAANRDATYPATPAIVRIATLGDAGKPITLGNRLSAAWWCAAHHAGLLAAYALVWIAAVRLLELSPVAGFVATVAVHLVARAGAGFTLPQADVEDEAATHVRCLRAEDAAHREELDHQDTLHGVALLADDIRRTADRITSATPASEVRDDLHQLAEAADELVTRTARTPEGPLAARLRQLEADRDRTAAIAGMIAEDFRDVLTGATGQELLRRLRVLAGQETSDSGMPTLRVMTP